MGKVLLLAWRNIWRNRRRTFINMSAIGVGLFLVVVYSGLIEGVLSDAKNQLDNAGMGHVEVFAKGFRPRRAPDATLEDGQTLLARLSLPPGADIGARVISRGLASSARGNEGVELLGVDFEQEKTLSAHLRTLREGALPEAGDERGVLVGEKLAERLKLKLGSKLRVMVQRADGEMGADLFRVRGVYHSIAAGISKRQVYVSTAAARTLLGLEGRSHQLLIQLPDPNQSEAVAAQVRAALGPDVDVLTWGDLMPLMKRMEGLTNSIIFALAFFVYALVGLGILNTMLMSVLERTREFGVLLAVGTRPSRVVTLVLAESFWIATLAVVVGLALGLGLTWYGSQGAFLNFSAMGEAFELGGATISTAFNTEFNPLGAGRSALLVYVMALIVGLYPAWRVSKLQPAEALRRN